MPTGFPFKFAAFPFHPFCCLIPWSTDLPHRRLAKFSHRGQWQRLISHRESSRPLGSAAAAALQKARCTATDSVHRTSVLVLWDSLNARRACCGCCCVARPSVWRSSTETQDRGQRGGRLCGGSSAALRWPAKPSSTARELAHCHPRVVSTGSSGSAGRLAHTKASGVDQHDRTDAPGHSRLWCIAYYGSLWAYGWRTSAKQPIFGITAASHNAASCDIRRDQVCL